MKKYFIILAAAFAALLSINSCASKDDTTPETPANPTYLDLLSGEWKVNELYGFRYEEDDPYPDGEGEFFSYEYGEDKRDYWKITASKEITHFTYLDEDVFDSTYTLNFEELSNTAEYKKNIWGKFVYSPGHTYEAGLQIIDNDTIIITQIMSTYFSSYRCSRIK